MNAERLRIAVRDTHVAGLLQRCAEPMACYVLAHGAGAGMDHPFMRSVAEELGARRIATLRYNFPYMQRGAKRPDPPELCHLTVRAAIAAAQRLEPTLPLVVGGKSFGGRMSSQALAASPDAAVRGLAFLGFPLHVPNKPSDARAEHLFEVRVPMLFVQGTRDAFAELALMRALTERLGARATLAPVEQADHSFHVPARSGRTDAAVRSEWLDTLQRWVRSIL